MVAVISLNNSFQKKQMLLEMSSSNEDLVTAILAGIRYPMSIGDNSAVHREIADLKQMRQDVELFICDADQRVVFSTEQDAIGRKISAKIADQEILDVLKESIRTATDSPGEYSETIEGKRMLTHIHVIPNMPECYRCHGMEQKVVGASVIRRVANRHYEAMDALRHANLLIGASGMFAIVGLVHLMLSRLVVQPVRMLAEEIKELPERIAEGSAIKAADIDRSDEIGALQRAFHEMAWELDKITNVMDSANRELEYTNRELESFAYSVSHDLRAPLRNIDGFSKILLDDYSETLDDQAKHYLNRVRNGAMRMSKLIDDILIFSRIGRTEMQFRIVKAEDLIRNVLEHFSAEIEARKVKIIVGDLPKINCDSVLAQTLFTNIVSNALKYTRNVEHPVVEIGYAPMQHAVFVRDNGAGFDMKYHDKIFQVFQRLHLPEEFEGTGIGLAIVKRVAERHHWQVSAESKPGEGAVFFITIPELKED